MSSFRFTDEATSSKYACVVCYTVPSTLLQTQCCGAVYCLQCGEQAQQTNQSVTNLPQASVCTMCASENLQLYHNALLQENINKLQVECLHTGCGWTGELGNSRVHTAESHDGVCIGISTETAHLEQVRAEQYYTPALSQPPIVDDSFQDDESSLHPSTSTDTQLSAGQVKQEQLQSIPEQDNPHQISCNCCRNSEFADLNTVEKL